MHEGFLSQAPSGYLNETGYSQSYRFKISDFPTTYVQLLVSDLWKR